MKKSRWEFDCLFVRGIGAGLIFEKDVFCIFLPFFVIGWEKTEDNDFIV